MNAPKNYDERQTRLYAPAPIPPHDGSRDRCNVYVPVDTTAPWWVVLGRPMHGEHVEATAFETKTEARAVLRRGFLVDARSMFEPGLTALDVLHGISVQYATRTNGTQPKQTNPGE